MKVAHGISTSCRSSQERATAGAASDCTPMILMEGFCGCLAASAIAGMIEGWSPPTAMTIGLVPPKVLRGSPSRCSGGAYHQLRILAVLYVDQASSASAASRAAWAALTDVRAANPQFRAGTPDPAHLERRGPGWHDDDVADVPDPGRRVGDALAVVAGGGGDDPVPSIALAQAGQPPQGAAAFERLDFRLVLALEVEFAPVRQVRFVQRAQRSPGMAGGDELAGSQDVLGCGRGQCPAWRPVMRPSRGTLINLVSGRPPAASAA